MFFDTTQQREDGAKGLAVMRHVEDIVQWHQRRRQVDDLHQNQQNDQHPRNDTRVNLDQRGIFVLFSRQHAGVCPQHDWEHHGNDHQRNQRQAA